eukprot:Hpha_TRINITY_DN16182_c1_g7::TRINITY_DN16182_c1_g7_i1::g.8094::m.8094
MAGRGLHLGRSGMFSNKFLGINWMKRSMMPYQWGYPYGFSQYKNYRWYFWGPAFVKELGMWGPFALLLGILVVSPSEKGMREDYGTWPTVLPKTLGLVE